MNQLEFLKIPKEVLYLDIPPLERLVLAEIVALSKDDPCTASNEYIAKMINLNKRQVMRAIKNLSDGGYINLTFISPVKRQITSTKICTSTKSCTPTKKCSTSTKNGTSTSTKICTSNSTKKGTSNSTKICTQEYIETIDKTIDKNIGEDNAREREDSPATIPDEVLKVYTDNIHLVPSPIELEKLADDVKHFKPAAVVKAIERAVLRNKRSLLYIEGILRSWETDGYDEEGGRHGKSGRDPKQDDDDSWAEQFAHLGANDTG